MIPDDAVEAAAKRKRQAHYLSIGFYAVALTLGLAAFILTDGRSWIPSLLGVGSFIFAALTFLTARASSRWAKVVGDAK